MELPPEAERQIFAALELMEITEAQIDYQKLEAAREAFKLAVPPPYDALLAPGQLLPTRKSYESVKNSILADEGLSIEEKIALRGTAYDRWTVEVEKTFPEAMNY